VTNTDKATLRALSESAFGQKYRLELMLLIAGDLRGDVYLTDLASEAGLGPSQIQGAFRSLVEVGLLTPAPSADPRRKVYRADRRSAAWAWAAEMAARAA
jgi:DNA-binding IclR family transcriptional regulator